jgi:hypothetical protein
VTSTLKIVRVDRNGTDIDSVDFLGGLGASSGITLARDGWQQQTIAPNDSHAIEVLTLNIRGTSNDNLATQVQYIAAKIQQVQQWLSDQITERYMVMLRVKMHGETYDRQAFIYALSGGSLPVFNINAQLDSDLEYQVTIDRGHWEDTSTYPSTASYASLSSLGGVATLSETIRGDLPARLLYVQLLTGSSYHHGKYWIGWKTSRFGNAANFVPVWAAHLGNQLTDTTTAAEATAYDGTLTRISFATDESMVLRTLTSATNASALHPSDQRGSYSVLMRARMTASSSVARVQMAYALTSTYASLFGQTFNSRVPVSGTDWHLYEVGTLIIPATEVPGSASMGNSCLGLYAERYSGSASLEVDCFILIPRDDGMAKISFDHEHSNPNAGARIDQNVQGEVTGTLYVSSVDSVEGQGLVEPLHWELPNRDDTVYAIVAADGLTTASDKASTMTLTYKYIPRWLTLRGSEA